MKMGIGVIIRDSMGEILATLSEPKDYINAPDIAEATAALRASKFSSEFSFFRVVLECNALQIVQALKKDWQNLSIYEHLIEDTQWILNSLQRWQVYYISRNLNGMAHWLTKKHYTSVRINVFLRKPPMYLRYYCF
jgi:hypothetical protein